MKIYERIYLLLKENPKATKEIYQHFPDKHLRCIAATISNYPELFLRLDKGFVGLKGRDEHLVKDWKRKGLPLYKKMVNCLQDGPKTTEKLFAMLPDEKPVSIRASATIYPHIFIRVSRGMIGRKNRDEWLIGRFKKRSIRKERKIKRQTVAELLEVVLSDGPKTVNQIRRILPHVNYNLLTCKLSLGKQFVNEKGKWRLDNLNFQNNDPT